MWRCAAK